MRNDSPASAFSVLLTVFTIWRSDSDASCNASDDKDLIALTVSAPNDMLRKSSDLPSNSSAEVNPFGSGASGAF